MDLSLGLNLGTVGGAPAGPVAPDWVAVSAVDGLGEVAVTILGEFDGADTLEYQLDGGDWVALVDPDTGAILDTSTTPPIEGTWSSDGTDITYTITAGPAALVAGSPYTAEIADFATGPVNLLPASVTEAAGVYTAVSGFWAFAGDDAPLYAYAWRSGDTAWSTADGVATDGLSFEPVSGTETQIAVDGLQFVEVAANLAGTRSEAVQVVSAGVLEAIRYSPSRVGNVQAVSFSPSMPPWRKLMVVARFRVTALPASGYFCLWGDEYRHAGLVRSNGQFTIDGRNHPTNDWSASANSTVGLIQESTWYSLIYALDYDGFGDGKSMILRISDTIYASGAPSATNYLRYDYIPLRLGGTGTSPWKIFNGDIAPFFAVFYGDAADPRESAVWNEVFDSANGNAFRAEYLNGTKQTIAGLQPDVVLRGLGMLNGINSATGSIYPWHQVGAAQEAIVT